MKNGRKTSEQYCRAIALRPLVRLFGTRTATGFGPLDLLTVRKELCKPLPPPAPGERRRRVFPNIVRSSVNKHVERIRRVFRWGAAMQLVPVSVWQSLSAVESLRYGESQEVRESAGVPPVAAREVAIVLRHVRPGVAACIRLQWLTGMRPQEVVQMRMADIARTDSVWTYRPQVHKLQHHGRDRQVMLGPKAQRVLAPFVRLDPQAWLFPGADDGRHLSESAYRSAIRKACLEAGIAPWAPNRLRHSAATRIRSRDGLEAARTILGHSNPTTTLIYAERDMRKAAEFARAHG